MSYCKVEDVAIINGQRKYDENSTPNYDEVESIISLVSSLMDSRFKSLGFAVPVVSDTVSTDMLKTINTLGAAALSERSSNASEESSNRADSLWTMYENEMDRIERMPLNLKNSVRSDVSCFTSYSRENPSEASRLPRITLDKEF